MSAITLAGLFKPRSSPRKPRSVPERRPLPASLDESLGEIRGGIGSPSDLAVCTLGGAPPAAALVYLESLADGPALAANVVAPLNKLAQERGGRLDAGLVEAAVAAARLTELADLHRAVEALLAGRSLILIDGADKALSVYFPGFPRRPVEEPGTERVTRGPREGFTEVLQDNLGLVRRWIKDPNLRVESRLLGERTKTETAVVYLHDVANPDIVREVHRRLERIDIDGIIDSGYIAELIKDNHLTAFPLIQETERPDKVAASVLEGRIAILVDKSPFALIVPATSNDFYQTPEEFYLNFWVGTFIRLIRAVGTLVSVSLPGLYAAIVGVDPLMAPASLIQVLASGRTQIPYPVICEIFFALLVFEIFREAVIRVPANVNLVLGIAGGVLLGYLAVSSGLVAGATVIVVIIATLASYSTASVAKEQAWRLARYFMLFAGGAFGIYGLTLSGLVIFTHLASLKSFGVSYLAPWAPPLLADEADAVLVLPWWLGYRRPPTFRPQREDRLGNTRGEDEADT